jgi:hypothetical protein
MKTCEWSHVTPTDWCFVAAGRGRNRRTYATVRVGEGKEKTMAHVNATNQVQYFSTWEEAKTWVETEVGKLFKTYK